eukprot:scaffold289_cov147-Amphora_coffeaeformis.AAC.4
MLAVAGKSGCDRSGCNPKRCGTVSSSNKEPNVCRPNRRASSNAVPKFRYPAHAKPADVTRQVTPTLAAVAIRRARVAIWDAAARLRLSSADSSIKAATVSGLRKGAL